MSGFSIRTKLIAFLVGILLAGQIVNLISVNTRTRSAIAEQAKSQLARAEVIATQHIKAKAGQLTESVRIAIQDYETRTQLVKGEAMTRQSVLINLANRIKVTRALLIDLDGMVIADSAMTRDRLPPPEKFAFPSMLDAPADGEVSTEIAVDGGTLYRVVVVPVKYPVTAAYVAIELPIDDQMASELRDVSAVPLDITFAYDNHGKGFQVAASTLPQQMQDSIIKDLGDGQEARPAIVLIDGRQFVTIERSVAVAKESPYVTAVLQYAIDDALVPYNQLLVQLSLILLVVLVLSLGLGLWVAESIARPISKLATAARRIGAGDYAAKVEVTTGDEVGQLGLAFNQMTAAIGEREERISHQADYDQLTDMPNRRMFERLLDQALAPVNGDYPKVTIALVGINRLPEINQTLGHNLGDTLITNIGPMIADLMPARSTTARISDSVFALLLPGQSPDQVTPLAGRIVHAFDAPVRIDDAVAIDASVGIGMATSPAHGQNARTLLQHADVALFSAHRAGGTITVYDPASDPFKPENLSLMGELRGGVARGELQLHYQPKIGLGSGRLIGAEALVRWIHPRHGFLPPDRFIPLAEESGTIHRLTNWALKTAIDQARLWQSEHLDLKVAVNLSVRDLLNKNLPDLIQGLLGDAGLAGEKLILEITESAIMSDPESAMIVLRRLADQGISLSVDDFGTGHSSFAYLRKLPLAELKVDKSFVLNLSQNETDRTIVRAIVDLGHGLDLRITAEGVEDQQAYDILSGIGCDVGQGYFMSRPLTLDKFNIFARESPYAAAAA